MARPSAIGLKIELNTLEDVDNALAELSYLQNQGAIVAAETKSAIDKIKTQMADKLNITVEGESHSLTGRIVDLESALETWIESKIKEHLKDDKKSIDLAHGTVGIRQRPLSIELAKGKKAEDVVKALNEVTKGKRAIAGFIDMLYANLQKLVKGFGTLDNYLTLKVELNVNAIKSALKNKVVNAKQLETIGLIVVEPKDGPVISPAKCVTAADAAA